MKLRRTPVLVTAGLTVVLAAATGTANAVVKHSAQQRIEEKAACRLQADGAVSAELTDSFAGLRSLTGDVGAVHVSARGVHRADTEMDVEADLYDVTTDGAVGGGRATARVSYGTLQKRLASTEAGMKVGGDANGLTLTGSVGDLGLPVTVHTRLATTATSLTLTPTTVSVLGRDLPVDTLGSLPVAGGLVDRIAERLAPRTIDIDDLPAGARLTAARPTASGLELNFSLSSESIQVKSADGDRASSAGADRCSEK
ncbi:MULTISPECIES: LmeA family phospholipid-binding protein [unclassified Streptomyces]|uniref:LmeA family phospholipid-binding protein n=1 Tax=unclassified Streptomyces TaxID=2593676 RepID=UPI00226E3BEB|nr:MULTISPECIES: LmeA family phospholipid-binding protein [unclassified Streptomyces]MCY0918495.1 LmeA family phospholipid-binding protein [Streptomyces sp. H27-G5]MCY0955360.1 LmeA family phospholipid-binding protein [Streptomyces sp. H27-H5]